MALEPGYLAFCLGKLGGSTRRRICRSKAPTSKVAPR
jgi:hypothetical protein